MTANSLISLAACDFSDEFNILPTRIASDLVICVRLLNISMNIEQSRTVS